MSALAWALVAVPLAAGSLLAVAGRRGDPVAPAAGVTAVVATLGLACAAAAVRPAASVPLFSGMAAGVRVDGLSAVMVLAVTGVTAAVLVYSAGDADLAYGRSRFFGLMLLFAGAMLVTVTATTLPLLLMAWEVMGATSWALIGFWWRQPRRVRAADTAFLTTRAADLGLYLAAGAALAGGVGSLRLDALPEAAAPWLSVATVGVVLAALGKSAQLPFSFWLSRAMAGPSPVSALLHAATMVAAGAYLLLRLHPLLAASGWAGPAVAWTGAVTALALGLVAVAQADLKQLLAASTCAQVGFMVLAAGTGGIAAGTGQWVGHAATKGLLFLAAGAWLTALGTKRLEHLRGAAWRYPSVGVAFTAGVLALAGLPPLSLWVTKDEVLAVAFAYSRALYAVGLAAAVVATVYSVKAAWYLLRPAPVGPSPPLPTDAGAGHDNSHRRPGLPGQFRQAEAGYDTEQRGTGRVPGLVRAALVPLALAAAGLGVLALPAPSQALRRAVGAAAEPSPYGWQIATSAAVALGAAGLTWRWAGRRLPLPAGIVGWLARWLDLERLAHLVVVRPTLAAARGLAAFDDRLVDGGVRQLARAGVRLARAAGRADDTGIDGAVAGLGLGARRLGALARRPQTGLLHQYYAQVVVALAVLAVFLLIVR